MAKITIDSHIHANIDQSFIESLPESTEFKISVVESPKSGLDHCIKADASLKSPVVYWEKRGDRKNFSRMVVGEPIPTNQVVVVEVPHQGEVIVATAYYGREPADVEPFRAEWTKAECQEWVEANPSSFWATHALVEELEF
jgi:hypothetical protein